ncbi:hypothetical protein K443DRAFT_113964 [Laccaria amethystina LaAM-08-1]|uniref:Uncharacterized protein n=1 Tax=Laccaria amethystina LaAM-08-1 TaxID=1095629 RepID=A0A0C9WNR3_9AGAR|nr:hypothetical protein K443DRAFT_113964 [Laccaria amethystina LaAM-08-1]
MLISIFIFCLLAHQLLRTLLPWLIFHDLSLFWIPTHSLKLLDKTVYEMVDLL